MTAYKLPLLGLLLLVCACTTGTGTRDFVMPEMPSVEVPRAVPAPAKAVHRPSFPVRMGAQRKVEVEEVSLLDESQLLTVSPEVVKNLLAQDAAPAGATAESGGSDLGDLAKKTQNPVADLISLPLQNNTSFNIGPNERTQNVLNIQPVVPVGVGKWNLINRTIAPIIYQPIGRDDEEFGLGDINHTVFLSPKESGDLTWGIGPIVSFPTASDEALGTEKWSAGPSVVVLTMKGPWVVGCLVNNIWSFAGDDDRDDVNQMLFQYFINYNLPKGWYVSSSPILTANWEEEGGDRWTVPFGGGVGKLLRIGKLPVNIQAQGFWYAVHPDNGPEWGARLQVQFLFPKK